MMKTEISPKGLKDPICECTANEWKDTSATIGYNRVMLCVQCGKNRVCG